MAWQRTNKQDLAEAAEKILPAALAYLSKREYATHELRNKLLDRGAEREQTEQVLASLQSKGYLSDARYAQAYVRDRREFHPCGADKIKRELRAKGIAGSVIEAALEAEYDESRQRAALVGLLHRAAAAAPTADAGQLCKYRDKIIRRMISKGFSQAMILDEISDNFI